MFFILFVAINGNIKRNQVQIHASNFSNIFVCVVILSGKYKYNMGSINKYSKICPLTTDPSTHKLSYDTTYFVRFSQHDIHTK